MSQLQIFFIMPINRRQNLNEKKTRLLTRPLLPYYSKAGTVQGLLLGRRPRMYLATVTSRERTLYMLGGFIQALCVVLREETARS